MCSLLLETEPLLLIVDDDPTQRLLLEAALKDLDVEIASAASGVEAIGICEGRPPALVFLDIMMPEQDGFETCRLLRALPGGEDAVVVMMTGLDSPESVEKAYHAGANDFTPKPLSLAVIRQRARYQLRAWESVRRLRHSEARLSRAQRIAQIGDWEMDLNAQRIRGSGECCRILGLDEDELDIPFDRMLELVHPDDRARMQLAVRKLVYNGIEMSLNHRLIAGESGESVVYQRAVPVRDARGEVLGVSGVMQDVTREKMANRRIKALATNDELTGFLNRDSYREHARIALSRALSREVGIAFLLLDIDGFREVNAALGYKAGDEVLRDLAARVRTAVASVPAPPGAVRDPLFARVGGDELIVLAEGYGDAAQAAPLGEAIMAAVRAVSEDTQSAPRLTASMGLAIGPADGMSVDALQIRAEAALMRAKAEGRGRIAHGATPART